MQKEVNSKNSVPLYLFHQGTNSKAYEYMGLRRAGIPNIRAWPAVSGRRTPRLFRWWETSITGMTRSIPSKDQ